MDEGSYWARVRRVAAMMDMRTALVTDAQLADALHVLAAHEDRARGGRAREPGGGLLGEKRLPEAGRREGEARGLAEVSSMQGELEEQQHRLLLQRQQLRGGGGDEEQRVVGVRGGQEEEEGEDEEVAAARKIKDAVLHPDTGQKIFLPLRLSFIVPCNLVLDTLMLSARGPLQNVGAQWLNQTYNSLHYYANRNASNEESPRRVLEAYLGATASSVGAAVGLNAWIDRAPPGAKWAPLMRRFVPFCAVAAADLLNLGITRRNEYLDGIRVFDASGAEVGRSRTAGALAVGACIGGRIAAAAPILILPPLIMHRLEQTQTFVKKPWLKTPALMGMIGISIQVCVPLFFGIFRQQASVEVHKLEAHLHDAKDKFGRPIDRVTYNKGI